MYKKYLIILFLFGIPLLTPVNGISKSKEVVKFQTILHTNTKDQTFLDLKMFNGLSSRRNLIYYNIAYSLIPRIPKNFSEQELTKSVNLFTAGVGYQKAVSPITVIGFYSNLDISSAKDYMHFNVGIEGSLYKQWYASANLYFPIGGTPEEKIIKRTPEGIVTQHTYYLEKGNFGFDTIVTRSHLFKKPITSSVGFYYFQDQYALCHVLGGVGQIEYNFNSNLGLYTKISYDPVHGIKIMMGAQWEAIIAALSYYSFNTPYWLPQKRHLAPRYLLTTHTREATTEEKQQWWQHQWSQEQERREAYNEQRKREEAYNRFWQDDFFNNFRSYTYGEPRGHQQQNNQSYGEQSRNHNQNDSSQQGSSRQGGPRKPPPRVPPKHPDEEITPQEYFAKKGYDISRMTSSELKKMYYKLARQLHPDKNGSTREATLNFQILGIQADRLNIKT